MLHAALRPRLLLACLAPALAVGCRGPAPLPEPEPYTPPPAEELSSIGFFLTDFDAKLRAWSRLRLVGRGENQAGQLRALEIDMRRESLERIDELIDELDFGVPRNRSVAAAALGFTGDARAQAPLLATLAEDEPELVQHALLALGLLSDPATPVGQITYLLRRHEDDLVRSNAAFALQRLVLVGVRDEALAPACLEALVDPEPGVRAQAAAVLGILEEEDAIQQLAALLADEYTLVVSAAATSLARIGASSLEQKGTVARLLVEALEQARGGDRDVLLRELTRLREGNLGREVEPWKEWAYRLP